MTILKRYLTRHGDMRSVCKAIIPSCRVYSTITPIHQSAPAKQPISLTQSKPQIDKIDYEPLPRSLSPSRALLLLSIPISPRNWPARLEMASGLLSSTTKVTKKYNVSVNMVYDSTGSETDFPLKVETESYPGRLSFHDGKVFDFPRFNNETLTSEKFLKSLEYRPGPVLHDPAVVKEVYVCTHGSRDCRCSERGGDLVDTLREQVKVRGLHDSIRIGEIAHVGGHKYAANAITLPSLDMFSNLSTSHAEKIIDHLVNPSNSNEIWQNWRGRYGMTEKEQSNVWSRVDPDKQGSRKEVENLRVDLRFKTWDGDLRDVKADIGETLLQVAKRHDLPSMEGTCGGNLECATCHCYLPKSPPIPSPLDEEFDMLGYAVGYRDGESRLGCQIKVTPELAEWVKNGGVIGLPRF